MSIGGAALGKRTLVVDDFATMRRVVRGMLREMGFDDALEAADGAAALECLRAATPPIDLVITDIGMPTMNGFDLLAAMKKVDRLRRTPVLMLTAEARRDDIVRCMKGGAADYLVKPFGRAVLEAKLRRAVPGFFAEEVAEAAAGTGP